MPSDPSNFRDTHLDRWEAELSDVKEDVASLKTGMAGLQSTMMRLDAALTNIANSISQSYKPQWSAMAAWAALLLSIGGLVWSNVMQQVGETKAEILTLREGDIEGIRDRAAMAVRIEYLERGLLKP